MTFILTGDFPGQKNGTFFFLPVKCKQNIKQTAKMKDFPLLTIHVCYLSLKFLSKTPCPLSLFLPTFFVVHTKMAAAFFDTKVEHYSRNSK